MNKLLSPLLPTIGIPFLLLPPRIPASSAGDIYYCAVLVAEKKQMITNMEDVGWSLMTTDTKNAANFTTLQYAS
jgi:hypothetical protein